MNKELEQEILESQNLPRTERRKKELELQRKYNDKSIKIKSGKTFTKSETMSRTEKREFMKDKNFVKEIIKIIQKYLPELSKMLSELTDKRNKSYITYQIRTIIMVRLLALICGITTMKGINDTFDTETSIKNLSTICNQTLKEVPDWQTIQDVIEKLNYNEIDEIRQYIFKTLLRSKMFDRFRYKNRIQLIVDATGLKALDYNLNNNCLTKTRDGKTKYYKYVLEAKVVFGSMVISIDSEWIENTKLNNENQKQDCEIKAFKRMAPRIKKRYPKLRFIITGDALYASTPMINICNDNKWDYIFNLKKDRLKNVYEEFQDNVSYQNETSKENYALSTGIIFNENTFNALSYTEITDKKTTVFNYITNLEVNNSNIDTIVVLGRKRWKIENEGFNEQKNGTYNISHLCSRFENALKIHYLLIQIAHIIRQLFELGSLIYKECKRFVSKNKVSKIIVNLLTNQTITNLESSELNFQLRFDD